jgi:hypothetical protein
MPNDTDPHEHTRTARHHRWRRICHWRTTVTDESMGTVEAASASSAALDIWRLRPVSIVLLGEHISLLINCQCGLSQADLTPHVLLAPVQLTCVHRLSPACLAAVLQQPLTIHCRLAFESPDGFNLKS